MTSSEIVEPVSAAPFRRMQTLQAIGPNQLITYLEKIAKEVNVDQWKNIPMPVCEAVQGAYQSVDLLKRFVVFLETRFDKLMTSTSTSNTDLQMYV